MQGMNVGVSRWRGGIFDWNVGGLSVDPTGAPLGVAGSTSTWNLGTPAAIAPGAGQTFFGTLIQPAPATSTPGIGRLKIDEIKGRITLAVANSGVFYVACGIFVSDLNNTTTLWNVRNPTVAADCVRDDYIFLEGKSFQAAVPAAGSDLCEIGFDFDIKCNVIIGGGQALAIAIYNATGSAASVGVTTAFRVIVGPVA
jgi:hypothetical protein